MVKRAFQNLEIEFWAHRERLGLSTPSLCLFHHSANVGMQLLDALVELRSESPPAQRVLSFKPCQRKSVLTRLRLKLVAVREDLQVMNIRRTMESATIELTEEGLSLLTDAVISWLRGAEDFGIAPHHSQLKPKQLGKLDKESGELWFWGPGYGGP